MIQNKIWLSVVLVLLIAISGVAVFKFTYKKVTPAPVVEVTSPVVVNKNIRSEVIGKSVENREIKMYSYGNGDTHLLFVGGVHGGYEWNSVLLTYQLTDYLAKDIKSIPDNLTIDIIPSVNPDGVYKVSGKEGRFEVGDVNPDKEIQKTGRFNGGNVDLNRNFDCKWKSESTWQSKKVSGGTSAFSEPESKAIKNYVSKYNPKIAVFWHSAANAVYASQCKNGILDETLTLMNLYSVASKYAAVKTFDAYETTGAADDWLASIGIPAITVEMKTHDDVEWDRNLAGIKSVMYHYGTQIKK